MAGHLPPVYCDHHYRHVISAQFQRSHFVLHGLDKPCVAMALLLRRIEVHRQVLYERVFRLMHFGRQPFVVLELELIAKLVEFKEFPRHLCVYLLNEGPKICLLAGATEDV